MSTFLQLAQAVARESGTLGDGTGIASVSSQTGRELKAVTWTAEAWVRIQNLHTDWRWMQKTYSGTLTSSTSTYTAASFSITDLRDWKRDEIDGPYRPHTIYLAATGVSDERALHEISWQEWRTAYGRGTQTNNYPSSYTITPNGSIAYGPIPDATYTVNGEYMQAAVRMTADGDTPGLPDAFHQIIVHRALMLMHEHDEGDFGVASAMRNYETMLFDLRRSQLPILAIGAPPIA